MPTVNPITLERSKREVVKTIARVKVRAHRDKVFPPYVGMKNWGQTDLATSFSHATYNVASRHLRGAQILQELEQEHGLNIIQILYDNITPRDDQSERLYLLGRDPAKCPKIFKHKNLLISHPLQELEAAPLKEQLRYQGAIAGIASNNTSECSTEGYSLDSLTQFGEKRTRWLRQTIINARTDELCRLIAQSSIPARPLESIISFRADLKCQLRINDPLEIPFSYLAQDMAALLAIAEQAGFPFHRVCKNVQGWDKSTSEEGDTFLLHFISEKRNLHARLEKHENKEYFVSHDGSIRISTDEIYEKLSKPFLTDHGLTIIKPVVPVNVYAMTVIPEVPHLGGGFWKDYAPDLLTQLCKRVGVDATDLSVTTHGLELASVSAADKKNNGIGTIYPVFGADGLREILHHPCESEIVLPQGLFYVPRTILEENKQREPILPAPLSVMYGDGVIDSPE